ncbi:hypothetical protein VTK26DRAFT_6799 [Humicola hyalothermophila]
MASTSQRGINLFIWICVFTVISTIFLILRLIAARIIRRGLYVDDGLVVFAYAGTVALSGVVAWSIFVGGMGKHMNEMTDFELGILFQAVVAAYVTWTLGTVAVKLSVLWMYTRIFRTQQFKRYAYVLMGFCMAFCIAFMAVFMTNCHPVSFMWKPVPGGGCRDMTHSEFASVSVSLVIDLAIIFLPMPWLWGLQMPLRNKIVVSVTLSIGFITIGVMGWRIDVTIESTKHPDFSHSLADIALISLLELWLGIIVACIPTLAPILKKYGKPALQKISKYKLSGASADSRSGAVQLGKFSNMNNKNSRDMYTELDSSQDAIRGPNHDLEDQVSVPTRAAPTTTTACAFDPAAPESPRRGPNSKVIHIRHDINMDYMDSRR